jgi:ketosteroid isomerase-like protein
LPERGYCGQVAHETDLIRAFFDAYNARDVDSVEALLHPDAKITTLSARAGLPARWEGRSSTRRYFQQLDESWAELRIEIDEYREVGGCVVAIGHIRGIGKASQAAVVERFATVFVIRGSQLVVVDTYSDPQAALEAASAVPAEERAPGVARPR